MTGAGFGKIILFGEHFVVYGLPALVLSLGLQTEVKIIPFVGKFIIDDRPKHPGFVPYKKDLYEQMGMTISQACGAGQLYSFVLEGSLPVTAGGIGASAAAGVAITRALSSALKLNLSEANIIEIALAGEKKIHGNPSGIDTVAACRGGLLRFEKKESLVYRSIQMFHEELPILIVDSGVTAYTKETIEQVAMFKNTRPFVWEKIVHRYEAIFDAASAALLGNDFAMIGRLFNEQNDLLVELGLDCFQVQKIRKEAHILGAHGSKMTGTGKGGLVLVLGRDIAHVDSMAVEFSQRGYFCVNRSY